jgi:hypothetical protein
MLRAAPRATPSEEDWSEDLDSRESGTRRVARQATPSPLHDRESQRPTVPAPANASLVAYMEHPPRISNSTLESTKSDGRVAIRMRALPRLDSRDKPTLALPRAIPRAEESRLLLTAVPRVIAKLHEIFESQLDSEQAFLLSLLDGHSDVDSVIDASPMSRDKTLGILESLRARRIIAVQD